MTLPWGKIRDFVCSNLPSGFWNKCQEYSGEKAFNQNDPSYFWLALAALNRRVDGIAGDVEDIESDIGTLSDILSKQQRPELVLTPRQIQVLGLMQQGKQTRDIAKALGTGCTNITQHKRYIKQKLSKTK